MRLGNFLKAKLLVALLAGVALIGGGTVVFAATPAGLGALHALAGSSNAGSSNAHATPDPTKHSDQDTPNGGCAGLTDAKQLASQFSLSTASDSDAVQAICALHAGTFTGTIPGGSDVSSNRVFGFGEIKDLLTYAQYLAGQDQSNQDSTLTTENARGYLAAALDSCGTTPLEACLKAHIPGYQPGNGNGNGNGTGKPTGTPTPPVDTGKPTSTPTPHN